MSLYPLFRDHMEMPLFRRNKTGGPESCPKFQTRSVPRMILEHLIVRVIRQPNQGKEILSDRFSSVMLQHLLCRTPNKAFYMGPQS